MNKANETIPYFLQRVDPHAATIGIFPPLGNPILYNRVNKIKYYLNWTKEPWWAFTALYPKYRPAHAKNNEGLSVEKEAVYRALAEALEQSEFSVFIVIAINNKEKVFEFWGLGAVAWNDYCYYNYHHHNKRDNASISKAHLIDMEGFYKRYE